MICSSRYGTHVHWCRRWTWAIQKDPALKDLSEGTVTPWGGVLWVDHWLLGLTGESRVSSFKWQKQCLPWQGSSRWEMPRIEGFWRPHISAQWERERERKRERDGWGEKLLRREREIEKGEEIYIFFFFFSFFAWPAALFTFVYSIISLWNGLVQLS